MAKNSIREAIDNPVKQSKTAMNDLTRIYWLLYSMYNIHPRDFLESVRRYVSRPEVCEQTSSKRTETKNNLFSAITKRSMTWLQFIRALKAADFRRIDIRITAYRGDRMERAELDYQINLHVGNEECPDDKD